MKRNILSGVTALSLLFWGLDVDAQTTFNMTGAVQNYVVPAGVNSIQIEAYGAQGGSNGGQGAYISGEFTVTPGETLTIIVGEEGYLQVGGNAQNSAGGGGGSFVYNASNTLLVAAGGGGGRCPYTGSVPLHADAHGQAGTDGGDNSDNTQFGGTGGNGGQEGIWAGSTICAGGGAGWLTAGGGGLLGGKNAPTWAGGDPYCAGGGGGCGGYGGFGGGGGGGNLYGGGGGGGGYSGGAGGNDPDHGGGGGSFNGGTNQTNTGGVQTGHGQVIITELCASLTTTVSATTVCFGDMVTLHAESTNGGTITWDNGVTDSVAFAPPVGTTTYTATSSDGGDCAFTVDVTVNDLPTVDAGVDQFHCDEGSMTTLTGSGAITYVWDNGVTDGVSFTPPLGTTTYTVTGTDANNCENTDMVDITVGGPMVTAVITHENAGSDGAIDITVTGGSGTYTYSWSNGPTTQDINNLIAGTYSVNIDDGNCTLDTSFTVLNVASVEEYNALNVRVFPNPSEGVFNVVLAGNYSISIYDVTGQLISTEIGNDQTTIDLSDLSSGFYYLNVIQDGIESRISIVKN